MVNKLDTLRQDIDALDARILELLSQRLALVREVGIYKKQQGIAPLDKNRWQKVLNSKLLLARKLGLDPDLVRDIYELIHQTALKLESLIQTPDVHD